MKDSWYTWLFVIVIIVVVLFALNFKKKDNVPLEEIFPEETSQSVSPQEMNAGFMAQEAVKTAPAPTNVAAPVKPKETLPAPVVPKPAAVAMETSSLPYSIQIASFQQKEKAESIQKSASAKGYEAVLVTKDLADKGIWYRVYIGKFETNQQAADFLNTLKKDYPQAMIIKTKK